VFLTYDITREETFLNLLDWLKEIKLHASEDARVYLIGNKAELEHEREVTQERALEFA
jgi:GTPase SAR1 family protein